MSATRDRRNAPCRLGMIERPVLRHRHLPLPASMRFPGVGPPHGNWLGIAPDRRDQSCEGRSRRGDPAGRLAQPWAVRYPRMGESSGVLRGARSRGVDSQDRPVVAPAERYRSITVSGHVVGIRRVLLTLLATLVIVAQAATSCPVVGTAHAVGVSAQGQDCADRGSAEDAAAPEMRRGAADHEVPASASPVVVAPRARPAGRRSRRTARRRPPPAGRELLHRLCIART